VELIPDLGRVQKGSPLTWESRERGATITVPENGVMHCWQCGEELWVLRNWAGTDFECPHCHATVTVPAQVFSAPPAARSTQPTQASASRKSPAAGAVLNFLFWGAGYVFAGRGWGWAILVPYILLTMVGLPALAEMSAEQVLVWTIIGLPIDILLAWHAYQMIKEDQSARA